jgi:hypothetical protein
MRNLEIYIYSIYNYQSYQGARSLPTNPNELLIAKPPRLHIGAFWGVGVTPIKWTQLTLKWSYMFTKIMTIDKILIKTHKRSHFCRKKTKRGTQPRRKRLVKSNRNVKVLHSPRQKYSVPTHMRTFGACWPAIGLVSRIPPATSTRCCPAID